MLKRSIIITLAMLVVYNLCLLSSRLRNFYSVQSQWQKNLITAQTYTLAQSAPKAVIVGSSLAAQMPNKPLQPQIYNLALVGGSAFTGLEMIEAAKSKPRLVAIEANLVWKKSDPDVIDNASRPVFSWLRTFLPAFREQWQPANLFAGVARRPIEKLADAKNRLAHKTESHEDTQMFKRMLDMVLEKASTPVDPALLSEQIATLHQHVSRLQNQGVRCAFIEMPVDAMLAASVRQTTVRKRLLEEFPATQFLWISPEQNHRYATTDGQHLQPKDAEAFALQIRTTLEQTNNWPTWRSAGL